MLEYLKNNGTEIGLIIAAIFSGVYGYIKNKIVVKDSEVKIEEEKTKRTEDLKVILDKIEETNHIQDAKLNAQQEQLDLLKEQLNSLTDLLRTVNEHLDLDKKKHDLKRIIKKESAKIIQFNPGLSNPNFSGMITLLTEGRDATINLGIDILFADKDYTTRESIANEVWSIFDKLKIIANAHIGTDFGKELRKNTKIANHGEILIMNLYEVVQGAYNGSSFNHLRNILITFMVNVCTESIEYWRKYSVNKEIKN
jgi:hypothetical protein